MSAAETNQPELSSDAGPSTPAPPAVIVDEAADTSLLDLPISDQAQAGYHAPPAQPSEPITTPAPPRTEPIVPDAPSHAPPAKGLPLSTPSSSVTPTAARPAQADLAEFDPYATPAPTLSSSASADPVTPARNNARLDPSSSIPQETPRQVGLTEAESSGSINSNTEPTFNFSGFLKDLRTKSAEPIARYLKSFLSNFAKKPFTVNEQIKLIHDFLAFISEKMAQVEPWKSQTPAEFDNALEAMEKLVMNRLYNYTFTPQLVPSQPITTDDLERDAVFAQRVRLFGWVREKHLDVPEGEATQGFLGFAEQELLKINHYKAPRDKMICILNCCKVIFGLIRNVYGAEATGADAFVPILIFVVLQANPDNMLSNIEYISRFRSASKLQGEAGYYLSSLSGAIAFIETMDASSLSNITQAEFEKNVEDAIQELPPSPSASTARALPPADMSPFSAVTSGEEAARPLSLTTTVQALDGTKRFFQRTGNLAQEAVSKPLSAIGKILETMQSPSDDRSEDGSTSGEERSPERRSRQEQQTPASRDVFRTRRSQFNRAATPESPSRTLQGFGLGVPGDGSAPASRAGTPSPGDNPIPDFSSLQLQSTIDMSQEAYAQTRRANVQTLHQMFPALDEDVVEAVLEGSGDDLGLAIDRLLEM
ncbi:hypothetical protein I203_104766 [Kwoniella mangroviensis CBS 8507]|uniref:uncharacterized protein n=1 Tax=Kwoniella mangroviensis CBS 8507 TaxID=1296122 RepID=UPI00080D5BE8|nr:uncharacterized protein I203_00290 [Kwoniella mangroviensis CBS 8507]OCF70158.1 hypothetical protein I203_00290 [Kwoniella mangroviensis CBS 8507]